MEHLLYYGADINAKNNSGNTPLHICAIHNQEGCGRILLFRGCDKTQRNLLNQDAKEAALLAGHQNLSTLIEAHREADIGK